jgi:enoyl-[acyl-carrier protein] reductase I
MSSAKAALESDTRTLAWEAGRKWNVRVNVISAGPLRSRAARAIGADATKAVNFIDTMIDYSKANAPLKDKDLEAEEIGYTAAFLSSPLASAISGVTLYVDNGLHTMGIAVDSHAFAPKQETTSSCCTQ